MVDLAAEVAQAAASGAAGRLAEGGIEAVTRLVSALRERFRGDAPARGTLEIALEEPGDAAALGGLEELLRDRIRDDAGFAAWLGSLWAETAPAVTADGSRSSNIVSGTVRGDVIQARDVHGGIHVGRGNAPGAGGDVG